jgi:hypothetical protein
LGPDFSYFLYFSDPGDNLNKKTTLSYGLRELSTSEYQTFCISSIPAYQPPVSSSEVNKFTADFEIRSFSSGCYYLDSTTGMWLSDGLFIQSDTILEATHCKASSLPTFGSQIAGSIIPLPSAIDFVYVFANAGFLQNMTIYLTVIIMTCLYIFLLILCRLMDRRDVEKSAIHLLSDNSPDDLYFYEVIVHTAARRNANTDSKVFMSMIGSLDETCNREMVSSKPKMKVFQRGSVNTFIISVKK